MVVTRSRSQGALLSGLAVKRTHRGRYSYITLKANDATYGYPIDRFCYERNSGVRIYFPQPQDMPKELNYPAFATDEEKKAADEKYKTCVFKFLPEKSKAGDFKKEFRVVLGRIHTPSDIPDLINDILSWAMPGAN